jgi:hypothetical protein
LCEKQVGDIRARDEEDEGDGTHQRPEHQLDGAADNAVQEQIDRCGQLLVRGRVLARKFA